MSSMTAIQFSTVPVNYGDQFALPNSFTATKSGLYWMIYSVVWDGTTFADYAIQGTGLQYPPEVHRLHAVFNNYDIISRDLFLSTTSGQKMSVATAYPTYGDDTTGCGWGGIRLDDLMNPLLAFDVTATTAAKCNAPCRIFPDQININLGNVWRGNVGSFIAPQLGVYYFSVSFGLAPNADSYLAIQQVQGNVSHCMLAFSDVTHASYDVISRGCLLSLQKNDEIKLFQLAGAKLDASYGETTFKGYLYSSVYGSPVAWSVCTNDVIRGGGSQLPLQQIKVNVGGAWNKATNQLVAPVSGLYYMEIVSSGQADLRLVLKPSGRIISRLYFASNATTYVTRSRPVLSVLNANDIMQIDYSNANVFASFTSNNVTISDGVCFHGLFFV